MIIELQKQIGELQRFSSQGVPTGVIVEYNSTNTPSPPPGYLKCDGSAVSRSTYKPLFDVVGTTYGVGNGSTTFNVPNSANRIIKT